MALDLSALVAQEIAEQALRHPKTRHLNPPLAPPTVTRYNTPERYSGRPGMLPASERMRAMRERRRGGGLREVRLCLPDARLSTVRERVAAGVAALNPAGETEALDWIERVSEFDGDEAR